MKFLYNLLIVSLFTISCSTERIETKNNHSDYDSAEDFLDNNKTAEQDFEVTKEGDGPITGKKGTKLWLGKDLLQYPNGDSVKYPFTIKLIELYSPKDMILYRMPSVAGEQLLTCHGEIRVRAYKDDIELMLRPEALWKLEIPNSTPLTDMICYYGSNVDANATWSDEFGTTFTSLSNGYNSMIKRLGWVSCAKPAYTDEPTIQYTFYSDSVNISNFITFIYLPNLDGLMQSGTVSHNLPIDEAAKIISVASKTDTLYVHYNETSIGEETSIELTPKQSSDTEFIRLLENL